MEAQGDEGTVRHRRKFVVLGTALPAASEARHSGHLLAPTGKVLPTRLPRSGLVQFRLSGATTPTTIAGSPSLYATFLCGFLAVFVFVEPRYQLVLATTDDTVALMLFLVTAFTVSSIIEVMRLGAARFKTSRDEAYKILEERDLLLRELVHRVKNDFQAASHLLRIQSIQVTHPGTKEALQAAADRISIMGRVHTRLTHQNQQEKVNLEAFLRELQG